jgi:hypothetical protein
MPLGKATNGELDCQPEPKPLQLGRSESLDLIKMMQRFLPILSRTILGLMLFAQLSVVVHACGSADPTAAFDRNATCHDASKSSANACLSHCTELNQTAGIYALPALPAATQVVLNLTPVEIFSAPPVRISDQSLTFADPPQSILYSSFLN